MLPTQANSPFQQWAATCKTCAWWHPRKQLLLFKKSHMHLISIFFWDVSDPICPIGPSSWPQSVYRNNPSPQVAAEFVLYQEILLSCLGLKPADEEEKTWANLVLIFCKNPQGWKDLGAICTHGIGSFPKRQKSHLHAIKSAAKSLFLSEKCLQPLCMDGWMDGSLGCKEVKFHP